MVLRIMLQSTRSTSPCYNDTTYAQYEKNTKYKHKHKIYAQWNGPIVAMPSGPDGGA